LVHDGYGDEVHFSALAQHLPKEWPVYGLPAVPPNEPTLHTVHAMAERMVNFIQQVQEAGPYRLAGWSFGGVLAYEIAQQLLNRGHRIEFLGLMDSFCPDDDGAVEAPLRTPEAVLVELCVGQSRATALGAPDPNPGFDELFDRYRGLRALPENFEHLSSNEARMRCHLLETHLRAMAAYRPQPIGIPVHLFVAGEQLAEWPESTASLGWECCVPEHQLDARAVPGSHYSMMKPPHIKVLGQRLTECLPHAVNIEDYAAEAVGTNA
jgi:arthrofactin-type cyclic lipopeptide synthetase C